MSDPKLEIMSVNLFFTATSIIVWITSLPNFLHFVMITTIIPMTRNISPVARPLVEEEREWWSIFAKTRRLRELSMMGSVTCRWFDDDAGELWWYSWWSWWWTRWWLWCWFLIEFFFFNIGLIERRLWRRQVRYPHSLKRYLYKTGAVESEAVNAMKAIENI